MNQASTTSVLSRTVRHGLCAIGVACALWGGTTAHAQSEASLALSLLPIASVAVVAGGSATSASEGVVAVPLLLSAGGVSLVVEGVEASAKGVKYVLKKAGDGASVVIEVSGNVAGGASLAVGSIVQTSAISAGTILTSAGKVVAFLPNEMGKALLHNERL